MKNFKDFIATKKKLSSIEFSVITSQDMQEFEGISSVYVYKEFYYINIYDNKNIGYDSANKKYGLLICNEYHQSDSLKELEVKLYNDFFIDNVEGSDEWRYEIGIHTPHQSALYYQMFKDMGFWVDDITYSNDIVDTLRLFMRGIPLFDVLLPNSATQDLDNEKFDSFQLEYLDSKGERGVEPPYVCSSECMYDTIDDLEEGCVGYLHYKAREYMDEMIEVCDLNNSMISLDEFLFEYKGTMGKEDYKRGEKIVRMFNGFKPLEDWYKFGCEPKNMFDDGFDIDDLREKDILDRLAMLEDNKNIGYVEDDATREFEECQSEVCETNCENEMLVSVAMVRGLIGLSNEGLIDSLKANVDSFKK